MKMYARATHGVLLPLLAGLAALAWYSSRSSLGSGTIDAIGIDAYLSLLSTGRFVTIAGFFVGGAVAAAATPWTPLCLGMFLTATGMSWLGFADPDAITAPYLLATFGRAMSTIGLWGALAKSFDGRRTGLRDALFVAAYTCVNIGAMSLTVGRDALRELEPGTIHVIGAVLLAFAFLGTLVLAGVAFVGREPTPAPEGAPPMPKPGPLALLLVVLFMLVALPSSLGFEGYALSYRVVESDWLNPAVVTVVGLLLAGGLAALYFTKLRFPTALSIGVGLFIWGFGIVLILLAVPADDLYGDDTANETLATVGMLVGAVGETLLIPLIYSRLSAGLPYRLGNVVLALYLIAVQLPNAVMYLLVHGDVVSRDAVQRPFGWLGALTAIAFGLVIAGAAWPTRKFFWPPEEDEQEATVVSDAS